MSMPTNDGLQQMLTRAETLLNDCQNLGATSEPQRSSLASLQREMMAGLLFLTRQQNGEPMIGQYEDLGTARVLQAAMQDVEAQFDLEG